METQKKEGRSLEEEEEKLGPKLSYWGAATTFGLVESKPEFTKADYASRLNTYIKSYLHRVGQLKEQVETDRTRLETLLRRRDEAKASVLKQVFEESARYHRKAIRKQEALLSRMKLKLRFFQLLKEAAENEGWHKNEDLWL